MITIFTTSYIDELRSKPFISTRFGNALALGSFSITAVADLVLSSAMVSFNVLTAGSIQRLNTSTLEQTVKSRFLISGIYMTALRILNPNARITKKAQISSKGSGIICNNTIKPLKQFAAMYAKGISFVDRQIKSRVLWTFCLLASPVVRTLDLAIAAAAAPASFLTLGMFPSINNVAFRALQAPAIFKDINYYGTHLINVDVFPGIYR